MEREESSVARPGAVERGKSFKPKTLRLHPTENAIIDAACEALNGMERTQLVQEAVIEEAARLGIRWSATPVPPLETSWPYLPQRKSSTEERVNVTVSLPVAELIKRAADHVHASEPLFMIGATLAHVGRLQKLYRGVALDSPEEARAIQAALERIKLPAQYEYRRRSTRG